VARGVRERVSPLEGTAVASFVFTPSSRDRHAATAPSTDEIGFLVMRKLLDAGD
jgi:hypothetical protein